jgi:hypothetical protein
MTPEEDPRRILAYFVADFSKNMLWSNWHKCRLWLDIRQAALLPKTLPLCTVNEYNGGSIRRNGQNVAVIFCQTLTETM